MFKKVFVLLAVALAVVCGGMKSNGDGMFNLSIYLNETEVAFDVSPYARNGTVLVPVRTFCAAMGIENVGWDNFEKTVTILADSKISFTIDSNFALKDGAECALSVPAEIKDGRTMVPVRFLAEALGAEVSWDFVYNCVDIKKTGISVAPKYQKSEISKEEFTWLARIVSAESAGEPFVGQVAVANVVLNRVASSEYPNTVYGVVFDTRHGVQFQPVANGTVYNTPSKYSVEAAKRAVKGENYVGECMYFLNESIAVNTWIVKNREYYTTINNHSFYI